MDHPAVADACVVGIPDEYSGEVPLAFVVLEGKVADTVKGNPKAEEELKKAIQRVRVTMNCARWKVS